MMPPASPRQHPESAILFLDDHVFMPIWIGKLHRSATLPGCAFVSGNKYIGPAQWIELAKTTFELAKPAALIERDWQHPFARGKHGRFVEHHPVPDAFWFGPGGLVCIRVFTTPSPRLRRGRRTCPSTDRKTATVALSDPSTNSPREYSAPPRTLLRGNRAPPADRTRSCRRRHCSRAQRTHPGCPRLQPSKPNIRPPGVRSMPMVMP